MTGVGIEIAANFLRKGEAVGIPTETVYGLAANALDEKAVLNIFKIKNRPFFDPLIVHTFSIEAVRNYVQYIPETALRLAEKFWPGPLTILLPKNDKIPDLVTSGSDLVAIRIPSHPITLSLLQILDFPLAAPSANPFGYISPTRAEHVIEQLGNKVSYVLDGGESTIGLESTIIACIDDEIKVFRLGGLSLKHIEECVGKPLIMEIKSGSNPNAPGQLDKHYSPTTPFIVTEDLEKTLLENRHKKIAVLGFGEIKVPEDIYTLNLSKIGDIDEAAKNLFHYMRLLDTIEKELIIGIKVPEFGLGAAINDRLSRASFK